MKRGSILDVEIVDYAFEGKGVARIELEDGRKFVIFVNRAYPGDKVKVQVMRKRKSYAEAKIVEFIYKSDMHVEARCSHYGVCGGCKQQDMDYPLQVNFKTEQVKDIFRKIGGFDDVTCYPAIGCEKIFFYRNKMEFSFAKYRWLTEEEVASEEEIENREFALGLHIPRMFEKVLDLKACYLQSEESNRILTFTREFFKQRNETIYSTKTHDGYLRHLVIKHASNTDDLMVNLVTSEDRPELMEEYTEVLLKEVPTITNVINNINTKKAQVALGDYEKVYFGPGFIYDKIGEFKYRISANSFFQTNTNQARLLYDKAVEYAKSTKDDVVFDLYSGAGTIGIYLSKNAREVYGFETVEPAVKDAFINIDLNGVTNYKPLTANLDKSFLPVMEENNVPKPDIIVADPPRGGMHPGTVKDILELMPKRIVYISCNPATQARDIQLLAEGGYKLLEMTPVDMFPHTYHIENVALLEL